MRGLFRARGTGAARQRGAVAVEAALITLFLLSR